MTYLTEQWKKGELPDEKEKHMIRPSLRSPADEIVIENQVWASTLHRSMVLQAENTELKELLKECRDVMDKAGFMFAKIDDVKKAKRLLKRIDEVLGEDR